MRVDGVNSGNSPYGVSESNNNACPQGRPACVNCGACGKGGQSEDAVFMASASRTGMEACPQGKPACSHCGACGNKGYGEKLSFAS